MSTNHTLIDICNVVTQRMETSDEEKSCLIANRVPGETFVFPARQYKDSRKKDGMMSRYCNRSWFESYQFLTYSKQDDGLFCLCCILFPVQAERGSRAENFIKRPYTNWKNATSDLKIHASLGYHRASMARMTAFISTAKNTASRIDYRISVQHAERVEKNRRFLKSILRALEYLGRQGLALRGHRDDGRVLTDSDSEDAAISKGNLKALLEVMCDTDQNLRDHLETCARNATYISKTTQNELLDCIKNFIQDKIVEEIKSQAFGEIYGLSADEVTDSANWAQLGIVVRYVRDNAPVERLLEYVKCGNIRGETIANLIIECLEKIKLNPKNCRSQTYDGAGNMAGKQKGAANQFQVKTGNDKATYFHCASHELNLSLSKASKVPEVHNLVCLLQTVGRFFENSPKRATQLQEVIKEQVNDTKTYNIMKTKVKPLCETRWVERHVAFEDMNALHEYVVLCLEIIYSNDDPVQKWDPKSVNEASGMHRQLTDAKFFISFHVCKFVLGFTKPLSALLQGSNMDIVQAYDRVSRVTEMLTDIRDNAEKEFHEIFLDAGTMASKVGGNLHPPRTTARQTLRTNIEATTAEEYWRRAVFIPYVDCIISQLNDRFKGRSASALNALHLIPSNNNRITDHHIKEIQQCFQDDMPCPFTFKQEVRTWVQQWSGHAEKPDKIATTLQRLSEEGLSEKLFPNIVVILRTLLTLPATSASVERANSALKYVKNVYRSSMSEDRLNALILMYVHKDIQLDYDKIIDIYANRHARRMMFINPLGEEC